MTEALSPELPQPPSHAPAPEPRQWQALPARARALFVVGTAAPMIIVLAVGGGVVFPLLARALPLDAAIGGSGMLLGAGLGLLLGAAFGLWWGAKRYRYTLWTHDSDGLAVRSGKLWRQETRVPATRVQHLDIKRGPWQRRRRLSTLVVHTAGTRHSAVTVPHLDVDDAEHLRDRLARQIDRDEF